LSHHVLVHNHSAVDEVIICFCLPILINLQWTNISTDTDIILVSVEHYQRTRLAVYYEVVEAIRVCLQWESVFTVVSISSSR